MLGLAPSRMARHPLRWARWARWILQNHGGAWLYSREPGPGIRLDLLLAGSTRAVRPVGFTHHVRSKMAPPTQFVPSGTIGGRWHAVVVGTIIRMRASLGLGLMGLMRQAGRVWDGDACAALRWRMSFPGNRADSADNSTMWTSPVSVSVDANGRKKTLNLPSCIVTLSSTPPSALSWSLARQRQPLFANAETPVRKLRSDHGGVQLHHGSLCGSI